MSTYVGLPDAPRVKIGAYPKRHGGSSFLRDDQKVSRADIMAESSNGVTPPALTISYADFFRGPAEGMEMDVA